jgi:hypothetical protein
MRVFSCHHCGQLVFFDNDECLRCGSPLGYLPDRADLVALTEVADGRLVELSRPPRTWQRCANAGLIGCNWLVPAGSGSLCLSCELTRTRPADTDTTGLWEFVEAERAKRRLLFQLGQLGLPVKRRDDDSGKGLAFDLLSSTAVKVVTGHDDGVITLDLAEALDEHRDRLRRQLNEPYRTVLGHFRHEIGHYYWPILVDDPDTLDACRALFGDDRADYAAAVKSHYADDAADDSDTGWVDHYISRYATMHPYEDWAECFAHYLHILDALQTAGCFRLGPRAKPAAGADDDPTRPQGAATFGEVIDSWLELSYGLNQVNQSMGRRDLYPFVLTPMVIRKLAFVDRVVTRRQRREGPVA